MNIVIHSHDALPSKCAWQKRAFDLFLRTPPSSGPWKGAAGAGRRDRESSVIVNIFHHFVFVKCEGFGHF